MSKKQTSWVTIPDDKLHMPGASPSKTRAAEPAMHKWLWAIGFVVVIVVTFFMLAPSNLNPLLKGNLFDAPGVEKPNVAQSVPSLVVFPGESDSASSEPEPEVVVNAPSSSTVIQPETQPVSIKIAPLSTSSNASDDEELDANQKLLEDLKMQIEGLKTAQKTPPVSAGAFPPPSLSDPSTSLHSSASEAANTTVKLGQPAAVPQYKTNPHTVKVHPQAVLQQNLSGGVSVANSGATTASSAVNVQPSFSANLANAQGTPESGPAEVLMIAFFSTLLTLMIWRRKRA